MIRVNVDALPSLVGKSFTLIDNSVIDIYMIFYSVPCPIFLIKSKSGNIIQIDAVDLIKVLGEASPELFNSVTLN